MDHIAGGSASRAFDIGFFSESEGIGKVSGDHLHNAGFDPRSLRDRPKLTEEISALAAESS